MTRAEIMELPPDGGLSLFYMIQAHIGAGHYLSAQRVFLDVMEWAATANLTPVDFAKAREAGEQVYKGTERTEECEQGNCPHLGS